MRNAACPTCHGPLDWVTSPIRCPNCRTRFEMVRGIPVLLSIDSVNPHKERQAEFFDWADAEFEIARPHGTTALYRWLVSEKLQRSVEALRTVSSAATALSVCGGSGMEAEFLARRGARVVLADISLGAVERALERARRFGFELTGVVADAERLPFSDDSFDLAYVHDGLHHLERPYAALAEMARVARRAVSVNEPARALVTGLAVRLRLSDVEEEAGNVIERLDPDRVTHVLEDAGFRIARVERYAMVYRHEPGKASRLLSTRPLFPLVRGGLRAFNAVAGRFGNKFTVQAVRRLGRSASVDNPCEQLLELRAHRRRLEPPVGVAPSRVASPTELRRVGERCLERAVKSRETRHPAHLLNAARFVRPRSLF